MAKLKEEGFESYDKIVQLRLKSGDGKEYEDPKQYINKIKQRDSVLGEV